MNILYLSTVYTIGYFKFDTNIVKFYVFVYCIKVQKCIQKEYLESLLNTQMQYTKVLIV